ncbi:SDR family oxidoreductase [Paenibacillus taiwanensis]|uniref:SDR family oxidoreductase n=1 Tax=Paenibacillus taiwanensis TaxID=401638 RepID=UPI0005608603|nr:SDR family oxidoreductase [Paenibacillus taiwanensis]
MQTTSPNKIVLVTGVSSGFGQLIVTTVAQAGHTVYATMRDINGKNAEKADEYKRLVEQSHLKIHVLEMDVTSSVQVEQVVNKIISIEGRIDVAVNNAGIGAFGASEAFTIDQYENMLNTNLLGSFRVSKSVLPFMRAQKSGLLVQISSIGARCISPFFGLYCSTKSAVETMAESLRYELSNLGIDSVIIEPGAFATQFGHNNQLPQEQDRAEAYEFMIPIFQQIIQEFEQITRDPNLPTNPQLVADAVSELIQTPAGERPLRTVVGMDPGVATINEATERLQFRTMEQRGIGHLVDIEAARAHHS